MINTAYLTGFTRFAEICRDFSQYTYYQDALVCVLKSAFRIVLRDMIFNESIGSSNLLPDNFQNKQRIKLSTGWIFPAVGAGFSGAYLQWFRGCGLWIHNILFECTNAVFSSRFKLGGTMGCKEDAENFQAFPPIFIFPDPGGIFSNAKRSSCTVCFCTTAALI